MAVGRKAVAGEVNVVADALRTIAVVAHAVETAGGVAAQTGGIDGCGDVAGAGKRCLDGGSDFVHANDVDDIVRSPGDGGHAVSTTVDVDDDAVLGNGIGASPRW